MRHQAQAPADFVKLLVYLAFFSFILTFYGLPLNILRDVYMTARSFLKKCRDFGRFQLATRNMDDRYPNATKDELDRMGDPTCIICREDLSADAIQAANVPPPARGFWARLKPDRRAPNETPKKLPCGHVFHFHCLRSWLERQQSCPTWYVRLL
jgi:E3 ubiquitin-protein ligase synoviolin